MNQMAQIDLFAATREMQEEEVVDLAGYQVTKAELFAHSREPAVTVWQDRIKFNMACLRRFPEVTHIQLLVHPEQKRMIVRPCNPDAPDSLRWKVCRKDDSKTRDMRCELFAAKLFELMSWRKGFKYKMLGTPAVYEKEVLFLFKLTDFELHVSAGKGRSRAYFPEDWRECFGVPFEKHDEAYRIDLADGYISSDR